MGFVPRLVGDPRGSPVPWPRSVVADRLSWDSSGLSPRSPPSTSSLAFALSAVLPPLRREVLNLASRPTSLFRTASPGCSARRLAGLLHPAAGHGVRYVSSIHPVEPAPGASSLLTTFLAGHRVPESPHRVSYPPKESPLPQPCRIAATVASSDFSLAVDPRPSFPLPFPASVVPVVSMGGGPSRPCSA